MKDSCRRQFWIVRQREGGLEVPIADEAVANVYKRAGWDVVTLPPGHLTAEQKRYLLEGLQPRRP
jgi:hypothetical protein